MSVRNILDGTIKVGTEIGPDSTLAVMTVNASVEVGAPRIHANNVLGSTITGTELSVSNATVKGTLKTQSLTLNNEAALVADVQSNDVDFIVTVTGSSEKLPYKGYLAFYHILPKLRALVLQISSIPTITFNSFYVQTPYEASNQLAAVGTAVIKTPEGYYPVAIEVDAPSDKLRVKVTLLNTQEKVTLTNATLKINTIFY